MRRGETMAGGLDDLINKLEKIKNNLAEEIAPEVNELFKESVRYSLIDWYNDYSPQVYSRTFNFMNVVDSAKTIGKGNMLTMSVDSGKMSAYPGVYGESLSASLAFDYFFMNGEHGHGKWMMHKSLPPYMYVDRDIQDGFGGRINEVIDKAIGRILN